MPGESHAVNDFIERLRTCATFDQLSSLFHSAFRDLGFGMSAYTHFHLPGYDRLPSRVFRERMVMTTSFPYQWQARYNERSYHRIDPVFLHCRDSQIPALWCETRQRVRLSDEQSRLFREAHDMGLIDGFAIPIHCPKGEFAVIGLASEQQPREFRRLVERHRHTAHLMAMHFHEAVQQVVDREEPQDCVLTEREMECLRWTAQGKSSWDIARILDLSERTVNFHMGNAMRKLDVSNRTHAVAKSIAEGLISLPV